jgi:hypothetical protein
MIIRHGRSGSGQQQNSLPGTTGADVLIFVPKGAASFQLKRGVEGGELAGA